MNLVDIIIVVILIIGFFVGSDRGFTKQLVSCLGFIVITILAFLLKNPVSVFLYEHLPFFDFFGIIKGISVLNIVFYELIAFLLILSILTIIWKILLKVTTIFEKFLSATIILGFPSKLLGGLLGLLENFVIIFIALYIISLPVFNNDILANSKLKDPILKETPILSKFTIKNIELFNEFKSLKDKYKSTTDSNKFNLEALDLLLKYDIVSVQSIKVLIENDKLNINNIDTVLKKYEGE